MPLDDRQPPVKTGIHARTAFPSPIYDNHFEIRELPDGTRLCVERPGSRGYDKHYWEIVP